MGGWKDLFTPDPPKPVDVGAAVREGVEADVGTLTLRRMIDAASRMGTKITYIDMDGKEQIADFTGLGDIDKSRQDLDYAEESADRFGQSMLDFQRKYGLDFVKQRGIEREAADPIGAKVREKYGEEVLSALERGPALDPRLRREADQASFAHAASTGNILGTGAARVSGENRGNAGWRQWQQTLANSAAFLSGTTPIAQFGQLSGAQQGTSPFNPMSMNAGIGQNPNAPNWGMTTHMADYNTRWVAEQERAGFMQGLLGTALGAASGGFGGGGFGGGGTSAQSWTPQGAGGFGGPCHVAREVFGADNPEWLMFYDWKELKAPAWFRKLYNKFSVHVARFISNKPRLKNIIRGWMRNKIK